MIGAADRALFGVGLDLRHQVVANLAFDGLGVGDVDVVLVGPQIGHLLGGDEADLVLRRGERHPEAAQQAALLGLAPDAAHRVAAVAPGEGREVGLVVKHENRPALPEAIVLVVAEILADVGDGGDDSVVQGAVGGDEAVVGAHVRVDCSAADCPSNRS